MASYRMGKVVFNERGYMVSELLASGVPEGGVTGFSLIGPDASSSIIYSSPQEALQALEDSEQRVTGRVAAP